MRTGIVYKLEVPHREPMGIRGFAFGGEHATRACAIIGSTRGNEVQQAFICARLVARLAGLERGGGLARGQGVLVIPCVNPYSMNILHRFWPSDDSDINRVFPGSEKGETTQRIAAGILRVAQTYAYGIQLCSFNQPGDFLPHVRITHQGPISDESLRLAGDFGLPYVMHREPHPFDKATLNYAWQASGTHAFSLYSRATDRLDERSACEVEEAVLRFLVARRVLREDAGVAAGAGVAADGAAGAGVAADGAAGAEPRVFEERELVDVRTREAAGYLVTHVQAGDRVARGQELAHICDAFDAHVLETLCAPVEGRVFFMRKDPLVQQHMVVFRIVCDAGER